MPELPEVETARRALEPALVGARFANVLLRRKNLRRPFTRDFGARLQGTEVVALTRRGKFILAELSSGDTLVMHLGMSGEFRIQAAKSVAASDFLSHDHVVFTMSSGTVIVYHDPRRFGSIDLVRQGGLQAYQPLRAMGPEPLGPDFDGAALARACAGRRIAIKVALLNQRLVAGVGNIYASEALHRAGISPRRRASSMATKAGAPTAQAMRLAKAIRAVLEEAIARQATAYRSSRFRVYERDGKPCLRPGCDGIIGRLTQAGRSTFYCPSCQR